MRVFDLHEKLVEGPASYVESQYAYLCRSGRPEAAGVRQLVESWVSDYPRRHRGELISRLRTRDDEHFLAAFFELYVFQLLRRLKHEVTIHPRVGQSTARRPDFAARSGKRTSTLLETVLAYEQSAADRAAQRRIDQAYDALNKVESPNFFVWIGVEGTPRSPIPGRQLRQEVTRFLESLDYPTLLQVLREEGFEALPTLVFEHDGCSLRIAPLAKSEEARGRPGLRPLGLTGLGEVRWIDNRGPTREAIKRKAGRYGPLRRPYIVAVNAADQHLDQTNVMEALFGQETFLFRRGAQSNTEPEMIRRPDGAWFGPNGPVNTRVSAILIISSLSPWSAAARSAELYLNPYARYPYDGPLLALTCHRPVGNLMVRIAGREAREVLELPEGWPLNLSTA